jgi:O-antigen/teichoic acid export membrane protein
MGGSDSQLNLGQVMATGAKYALSFSNESTEDALARRIQEANELDHRRKIQFCLFIFALAVTGIVFAGSIYVFIIGSPDDKKWAAGVVSSIASGLIGYLVGHGKK